MSKLDLFVDLDTKSDIRKWFQKLLDHGINFHPDDSFGDYVDQNGKRLFTRAEARRLNSTMGDAFAIAGDQVYDIGLARIRKHLKRR